MDRGAWWATIHRVAKRQTRLKLLGTCDLNLLYNSSICNHMGIRTSTLEFQKTTQFIIMFIDPKIRLS